MRRDCSLRHAPGMDSDLTEHAAPLRSIVVFDGICLFCNGWVRFIATRDRLRRFHFARAQSTYGSQQMIAAGVEPTSLQTIVLASDGRYLIKSDAILEILHGLGGAWRLVRLFRFIPRGMRDAAYDFIARNRYSIRGKADTCPLPPRALSDRFIE